MPLGKRDRAPELMRGKPAWRLNAHRSFLMTDGTRSGFFMDADDAEILDKQTIYKGRFRLDRYRLRHRLYDGGWSRELVREVALAKGKGPTRH